MKLPKSNEKFVVTGKKSSFYGYVVSGVHLDIRADDEVPDKLWYYVRVDRVYEGDIISRYGCYLYGSLTLEGAFDCIAQYLTPYQEQEEESHETADSEDMEEVGGFPGTMGQQRNISDDPGVEGGVSCCGSVIHDDVSGRVHRGCMIPEAAAALNHMFDSFNSLAADLLHLQYILTPALPAEGGAAHA